MIQFDFVNTAPAGATVAIKDTVNVTDPWGWGMSFEVLRSDEEHMRAFDEANPETALSQIQTRGVLMQVTGASGAQAIDDIAAKLEQRGVGMLQSDLEKSKKKLALVGIRSWSGITANGVEVPLDPLAALHLLGFRGVAYRENGTSAPLVVKTAAEWERMKGTGTGRAVEQLLEKKTSKTIAFAERFDGEQRNSAGEVIVIPRTRVIDGKTVVNPQGGNVFGHALALLLLEKSIEASATLAKFKEADLASFEHSPDTALGSGGSTQLSAPSSENEPNEASSAAPPAA